MKRPNTCANLIKAVNALAKGGDPVRLSRAMANAIVGQMLPDGVVKGGSSLMFRYGADATRYTRDIDAARKMELAAYLERLEDALDAGWNGFTGTLAEVDPPRPRGVPRRYVMLPYDVKLSYLDRPWQTVRIEIGHNEIGDADESEGFLPDELAKAFEALSFPVPEPLPVMGLSHQVAQKLHAVSEPGSERAHDLIDLQLMAGLSSLDLPDIRSKCERLFAYRRSQSWPPTITAGENWGALYGAALATVRDKGPILPTVDEAVAWTNRLVARIATAVPK
jgi:hypothetical protein